MPPSISERARARWGCCCAAHSAKNVKLTGCDVWPGAVRLCKQLPSVYDHVERTDVRAYAERCATGRGVALGVRRRA